LAAAAVQGAYVGVGHSYGGLIARLYASTFPEAVTGLVLEDALAKYRRRLWTARVSAQNALANLFPNAKHITNTNSRHSIHYEQPQIVIDAIRAVVNGARTASP